MVRLTFKMTGKAATNDLTLLSSICTSASFCTLGRGHLLLGENAPRLRIQRVSWEAVENCLAALECSSLRHKHLPHAADDCACMGRLERRSSQHIKH